MKKLVVFVFSIFVLSMNIYALNFSIGATAVGWGPTFMRGNGTIATIYKDNTTGKSLSLNMSFSPALSIIAQMDFIDYLGMEIGVGYSSKKTYGINLLSMRTSIIMKQISIPLLLKAQYEVANIVNLYLLVGPKFNFNSTPEQDMTIFGMPLKGKFAKSAYNLFDMDISFAIGSEFKLGIGNYIGIRAGYDMNLLGTFKNASGSKDKTFVDNIALSVTYRYKFRNL